MTSLLKGSMLSHFSEIHSFPCFQAPRDNVTSLEQTVQPQNDYFSAQFLLSFSSAATHTVIVSASVIDDTGVLWDTGPRNSMLVKTSEAPSRQQRAGPSRSWTLEYRNLT